MKGDRRGSRPQADVRERRAEDPRRVNGLTRSPLLEVFGPTSTPSAPTHPPRKDRPPGGRSFAPPIALTPSLRGIIGLNRPRPIPCGLGGLPPKAPDRASPPRLIATSSTPDRSRSAQWAPSDRVSWRIATSFVMIETRSHSVRSAWLCINCVGLVSKRTLRIMTSHARSRCRGSVWWTGWPGGVVRALTCRVRDKGSRQVPNPLTHQADGVSSRPGQTRPGTSDSRHARGRPRGSSNFQGEMGC